LFYPLRFYALDHPGHGAELVAQSLSALCTTASQNLAAVLGGHSLAEAVLLLSVQLLGLVSTLGHCGNLLSKFDSMLNTAKAAQQTC
jgi:hypothetical protein